MTIHINHDGPISRVILDKPDQNLLNIETMDQLVEAHREADAHPETRVIVTTSALPDMFSNGLDPHYVLNTPVPDRVAIFRAVGRMLHGLFSLGKPHISQINGPAMAGGAILAIASDFRFFDTDSGRMSFSEPKVGLPVPGGVITAINHFCDRKYLHEIVMLAANMDAATAIKYGLANGMARGAELGQLVEKTAARLSRLSPTVLRQTKSNLRSEILPQLETLANRGDEILPFVGEGFLSEGLGALVENRFANFTK